MGDILGLMEESDEKKSLEIRVGTVLDEAKSRQIRDDGENELMGEFLSKIKAARKEVNAYFDPSIKSARATVDELRAMSYLLSAITYELSAISYQLPTINHQHPTVQRSAI